MEILFRFYGEGNKIINELRYFPVSSLLTISDEFITEMLELYKVSTTGILYWELFIDKSIADIIIKNFTIFKSVHINAFHNQKVIIGTLKAENVDLHIVDLEINHIETSQCNSIFFADCRINEFYIDNATELYFDKPVQRESIKIDKVEVRRSNIEQMIIYSDVNYLIISESTLVEFIKYNESCGIKSIENVIIYNSQLDKFNYGFSSKLIRVEDSTINRMIFNSFSKVTKIEILKSIFNYIYGCEPIIFEHLNVHAWRMIKQSSYKVNNELYCESAFQVSKYEISEKINQEKDKRKILKIRLTDFFLKNSIGYGYKPFNAAGFIFCSILLFAFIYCLMEFLYLPNKTQIFTFIWNNPLSLVNKVLEKIYFSGITFTTIGYGDITPKNPFTRLIVIVEACLGIATMSLFITALTKKYLE